jgi:hypothetical protein
MELLWNDGVAIDEMNAAAVELFVDDMAVLRATREHEAARSDSTAVDTDNLMVVTNHSSRLPSTVESQSMHNVRKVVFCLDRKC